MKTIIIFTCFVYSVLAYCDLCNKISSCAPQLGPEFAEDVCHMKIYGNQSKTLCYHREIIPSENKYDFGDVQLRAYCDSLYHRTAFNISFSDIQWTELKMRFRQNEEFSTCRDFFIKENVSIPAENSFYYDCPWTDTSSEGMSASFEYEYIQSDKRSTRNFTFFIPHHEKLDQKDKTIQLFLYVDFTDLNHLKLLIQLPPADVLNYLNITDYDVYVYRTKFNMTKQIDQGRFSNSMAVNGFIEYIFTTWREPGEYFFTVVPFNGNDYTNGLDFASSKTPKIIIHKMKYNLIIGIVGVSTLIPIFIIILYMFKSMFKPEDSHKILFVYNPSNYIHREVVLKLASLLKGWYNLDILIDEWDIPRTNTKDPYTWNHFAFYQASYIIFFASPDKVMPSKDHIYTGLYDISLKLMKAEFCKKFCSKTFLIVSFPYSKKEITPDLINIAKCYNLPKKFCNLLMELNCIKFWDRIAKRGEIRQRYKVLRRMLKRAKRLIKENNTENIEQKPRITYICEEENLEMQKAKNREEPGQIKEALFPLPFNVEGLFEGSDIEESDFDDKNDDSNSELEFDGDIF